MSHADAQQIINVLHFIVFFQTIIAGVAVWRWIQDGPH